MFLKPFSILPNCLRFYFDHILKTISPKNIPRFLPLLNTHKNVDRTSALLLTSITASTVCFHILFYNSPTFTTNYHRIFKILLNSLQILLTAIAFFSKFLSLLTEITKQLDSGLFSDTLFFGGSLYESTLARYKILVEDDCKWLGLGRSALN